MKRQFQPHVLACLLLIGIQPVRQSVAADLIRTGIIPVPVSIRGKSGNFLWNEKTLVAMESDNQDLKQTVAFFLQQVNKISAGNIVPFSIKPGQGRNGVFYITLNKIADSRIGNEGYMLSIKPSGIRLSANMPAGIFYGLQTLMQLLPPAASGSKLMSKTFTIPCVEITDYPRFGWRGLMLDVSRHFFSKDEVKQYIDEMAKYKYNIFHWHLSDDQGWRIEIKSLPRLTGIGAYRVPRTGKWWSFAPAAPGEKATEGGYYTQEDIREVIEYAKQRFITILPEIDVPAHSLAMIAAYPGLSCTQLPYNVNPGSEFYTHEDNALCIGNDSVFDVLDKVFTEIAHLFPCPYIHIGGDEAYKGFWQKCPRCQKRMTDEHLANVAELQSYFVKRMEGILLSKGKKLIGWDEILEGGLAPEAAVMSWRGMQGGIQAAKMNHHVVMTPSEFCYLDLYQGEPEVEPTTYSMCRLSNCYNYDPVPDNVDEKYILGGQGNLWSESVATFRHAEYMTWPRSLALAEVYWSPKSSRNWDDFISRLEIQFHRLDAEGIKYSRSVYNAIITPQKSNNGDSLRVRLSTEIKGLDIYYTFDQSNPDNFYPKYNGAPLIFPAGATQLNVITYRNGTPAGEQINITKAELLRRL
jgi:hexosaminidase